MADSPAAASAGEAAAAGKTASSVITDSCSTYILHKRHMAGTMKEHERTEQGTFRNRMAEAANMPKDVVLGVPVITILGELEVSVENYKGILEYTDKLIRIRCKSGEVKISGCRLQIAYYTNSDMKITGNVCHVEFSHP